MCVTRASFGISGIQPAMKPGGDSLATFNRQFQPSEMKQDLQVYTSYSDFMQNHDMEKERKVESQNIDPELEYDIAQAREEHQKDREQSA